MHVVEITSAGDPDVLVSVETADPSPGRGEVLVAVAARVGATCLIDNTFIGTTPQRPRSHTVPHPVQDPTTPEPMGAVR